jgi:hypothetical protein
VNGLDSIRRRATSRGYLFAAVAPAAVLVVARLALGWAIPAAGGLLDSMRGSDEYLGTMAVSGLVLALSFATFLTTVGFALLPVWLGVLTVSGLDSFRRPRHDSKGA